MYAYKIWGVYAPACCPLDIEGQISDQFGENVSVGSEWNPVKAPLHHAEEAASIMMEGRRVGTAYRWGVA